MKNVHVTAGVFFSWQGNVTCIRISLKSPSRKITGRCLAGHKSSHKIRLLRKKFCPFKFWTGKENIRENSSLHKGNIFPARKSLVSDIPARSWKRDREFFYSDSLSAQYYQSRSRRDPVCNIVFMRIEPGTWNLTVFCTCSVVSANSITKVDHTGAPVCNFSSMRIEPNTWNVTVFVPHVQHHLLLRGEVGQREGHPLRPPVRHLHQMQPRQPLPQVCPTH